MAKKPITRTVDYLLAHGYSVAICEGKRGPYTYDVWGFDVEAKTPGVPGTLRIQCTDHTNHAARRKKLQAMPDVLGLIIATGDQAEVWSWHPKKSEPRREVMAYPETWPAVTPKTETSDGS